MNLIIERIKLKPEVAEEGTSTQTEMAAMSAPDWWVKCKPAERWVQIVRKDRVDNVGYGDVYEIIWSGLRG